MDAVLYRTLIPIDGHALANSQRNSATNVHGVDRHRVLERTNTQTSQSESNEDEHAAQSVTGNHSERALSSSRALPVQGRRRAELCD